MGPAAKKSESLKMQEEEEKGEPGLAGWGQGFMVASSAGL